MSLLGLHTSCNVMNGSGVNNAKSHFTCFARFKDKGDCKFKPGKGLMCNVERALLKSSGLA